MKRIITKERKDKKVRRNQLIIGGILIFLMIFSTLGYALIDRGDLSDSEKINYNGVDFFSDSGYWKFNVQGYDFFTKYNPEEIKDIYIESYKSLQDYYEKPLYFSGDPDLELKRNMNYFVLRINDACLNENCKGDYPIKNCSEDNVIIFRESKEERFFQKENCIFIEASVVNQTRYADAYLFKLLGFGASS